MLPKPTVPQGPAPTGPVGRITGTSVTELRFRIGPDEPVHLGEILLADAADGTPPSPARATSGPASPLADGSLNGPSPQPSARGQEGPFYLRVTDLEYGADARDGDWEERTAGALMAAGG